MLEYQVHGITWDRHYTIRAQFGITHPRLTEFGPKVRYHDPPGTGNDPGPAMRKDPDYVRVEKSPPEKFQPSIREIDAMLDGLRVKSENRRKAEIANLATSPGTAQNFYFDTRLITFNQ